MFKYIPLFINNFQVILYTVSSSFSRVIVLGKTDAFDSIKKLVNTVVLIREAVFSSFHVFKSCGATSINGSKSRHILTCASVKVVIN
jgi:hypothetical protein